MCEREFTGDERKGAVVALAHTLSNALNEPIHKMIAMSLVDHLHHVHGYEKGDTTRMIVEMEAEALRRIADILEETAVAFLRVKS